MYSHTKIGPSLKPISVVLSQNYEVDTWISFNAFLDYNPHRDLDTTLCDKVCQWLEKGRWFSPGIPVSSINKSVHHDITEILLKVALNTITLNPNPPSSTPKVKILKRQIMLRVRFSGMDMYILSTTWC